jgi:ankyrin repeat protein
MSPAEAAARRGVETPEDHEEASHHDEGDDDDETREDGDDNVDDPQEEDEEDEDEEEDDDDDEDNIDTAFDELILNIKGDKVTDAKGNPLTLDTQSGVDAFILAHKKILGRHNAKKQNLLHLIAGEAGRKDWYRKTKKLVKTLITTPWAEGDLLAQQDDDEKTPLYCAIATKDHRLAKAMCEAHPHIDDVIRIPSKRTDSLQKALQLKIPTNAELITLMIENSSPETLCAHDDKGLTPLHLAADYARSDDSQLNIVKSIVDRCPRTMDLTYEHKGMGLLSAYRYHEMTYQRGLEKAAREARNREVMHQEALEQAAREGKKRFLEKKDGGSSTNGQITSKGLMDMAQMRPKPHQPAMEPGMLLASTKSLMKSEPTGKGMGGSAVSKATSLDATLKLSMSKVKTMTKVDGNGDSKATSGTKDKDKDSAKKVKKNATGKKVSPSKVAQIVPTEESARNVKKFLKLYCLRTRNHDDAIEFLYGVQQGRFTDLSQQQGLC